MWASANLAAGVYDRGRCYAPPEVEGDGGAVGSGGDDLADLGDEQKGKGLLACVTLCSSSVLL